MFWRGFNRFLQCCSLSILSPFSLFLSSFNPPRVPPYFSPHRHPIASICYDTHTHRSESLYAHTKAVTLHFLYDISLFLASHASPLYFLSPAPIFLPLACFSPSPPPVLLFLRLFCAMVNDWDATANDRLWLKILFSRVCFLLLLLCFLCPPPPSLASAPAWWPTLASLWSPIMHCDGCVSAQPDLGETISKQQAEINSAVSPGNSFPLLVFLLSPSVWLSHSLTTPQHLFFLFLDPRVISPSLFRNPFPPRTEPSLAILSSVFLWFIYRLFLPRVLPSPASHAQAGTPRCTLSMVALWKVNNSVSVPAATAASSSVWLRRVSAAITQFNLLPRASRLQVASFSPKTSLSFFYTKRNRVWPRGALK